MDAVLARRRVGDLLEREDPVRKVDQDEPAVVVVADRAAQPFGPPGREPERVSGVRRDHADRKCHGIRLGGAPDSDSSHRPPWRGLSEWLGAWVRGLVVPVSLAWPR